MAPRSYGMDDAVIVAAGAASEIESWLRKQPETVNVQNVESHPAYQKIDVDLLWKTKQGAFQVEIKGDRWDKTGNFFFETHSNKERGTPGCFLYTEAHFVFYYFVNPKILYILPMPQTREWFSQNIGTFRERSTTTPIQNDGHYTTVGRLVPIERVLVSVPNVRKEQL